MSIAVFLSEVTHPYLAAIFHFILGFLSCFLTLCISVVVFIFAVCWAPHCLCMLLTECIWGTCELILSLAHVARFHGAFGFAVDGRNWTSNDGNYIGEINGSVWEITARRTEDKKSVESSGLFIDCMLKRVTARLESLNVIVSCSVCFHSFYQCCSSSESHFNYCCFLLIIFMTSHISLFIHQQCLQLLFEYVGFSLFALSLFKPDGRAATVMFFLLLHSALLGLYRVEEDWEFWLAVWVEEHLLTCLSRATDRVWRCCNSSIVYASPLAPWLHTWEHDKNRSHMARLWHPSSCWCAVTNRNTFTTSITFCESFCRL